MPPQNENTRLETGARFNTPENNHQDVARNSFSDEVFRERMQWPGQNFGQSNVIEQAKHQLKDGLLDMRTGEVCEAGRDLNQVSNSLQQEARHLNGATGTLANVHDDLQAGNMRLAKEDLSDAIRHLGNDQSTAKERAELMRDYQQLSRGDRDRDYNQFRGNEPGRDGNFYDDRGRGGDRDRNRYGDRDGGSPWDSIDKSISSVSDSLRDRSRNIGDALGEIRDARTALDHRNPRAAAEETREALKALGGKGDCKGLPDLELTDCASPSSVWGDPHLKAKDGSQAEDQIAAGKNVDLLQTRSGAEIVGQTASFKNPDLANKEGHDITVFNQESITLNDRQKILFKADGSAYHIDCNGQLGAALKDGETVKSDTNCADSVTYDAGNRKLTYNFQGKDGSQITGSLQGNIDDRGNYINTNIDSATGKFGGLMPAMKTSFNNVTVDAQTGAGAFKPDDEGRQRTNEDFYVQSLYG